MAHYKIFVQRVEEKTNFAAEMVKFEEERAKQFYRGVELLPPEKYETTNALICELTDEQFKKVKAEVFKAFE